MIETYKEMNARHTAEFNALPLGFAFSKDQFKRVLEQWNITEKEAEAGAILSIGSGGFIRATDKELYLETVKRIQDEENAAIEADKTGTGFIYQMFLYELRNHEFIITQDTDETLTALGISEEDLKTNAALRFGLCKAIAKIQEESDL